MKLKNNLSLIAIFAIAVISILNIQGCGIYSFSGTAINYDKYSTITIKRFENLSGNGPAAISQILTEDLRDYYQQNTRLSVLPNDDDGDMYMEGEIVSYRTSPSTPQASTQRDGADIAGQTRLTIGVKVSFVDNVNPEMDFERVFSFYADFESSQSLNSVEDALIDEIFEQIILDIFTATVGNW